jgi:hypothetical protein
MFLSGNERIANNDPVDRIGLRISAGLLVVLGAIFGFYVLFFAIVLFVEALRHWQGRQFAFNQVSSLLVQLIGVAVTAALTYLCFRAAAALRLARRWAANVAIGFGLMFLWSSGDFFYDWFHPEKQSADEYFGIFVVPFCIAIGLWWCIYLNVPSVRAIIRSAGSDKE